MREPGGDTDLPHESFRTDRRAKLSAQHFDGDLTAVLAFLGEMHRGHTALAEQTFYGVSVSEGRRESELGVAKVTRLEPRAL